MTEFDDLMTVREAAAVCGRSVETVRRWIAAGRLPARKLGHQYVVRRADALRACEGTSAMNVHEPTWKASPATDGEHYGRGLSVEERLAALDELEAIAKQIAARNGGVTTAPPLAGRESEEIQEDLQREMEWLEGAMAHAEAIRNETGATIDVVELVRLARGE
ncbi:MAG: helix-turn-helix domain-containing protein [Chloroflexi bacterium]|nr:helix-turn-helix domain-containing protein [Chloroflexota bacterium]